MKIYLNEYDKETLEKAESLLFNGNGHIGARGNLEEAYYDFFATNRETYINGFYEAKKITYPEKFFGFTETGETMVSVADGQTTLITIGGEAFRVDSGDVKEPLRYLDMEKGLTVRELLWVSPKGLETRIKIRRLASFVHKNIFAMRYEFEKINHDEEIALETHLNFHPVRTIDPKDPRMSHIVQKINITEADAEKGFVRFTAPGSGLSARCHWKFSEPCGGFERAEDRLIFRNRLSGGSFEKIYSYVFGDTGHEGFELSFEQHEKLQGEYLAGFWNTAKVEVKTDGLGLNIEESVNFGTYALLQSLGADGAAAIAAKGLSGSGYEGHYFWDTEMYIFPVFLHFAPGRARDILKYRIKTLDKARANREMFGYKTGALYPWRTISGVECSPFFEGGSAQHHINSDIAFAFIGYYEYTGDLELFFEGGFEVLVEAARVFTEIGYVRGDRFHIDKVTGPDEYTVLVNDNYFTNMSVKHHFTWTYRMSRLLKDADADRWARLTDKLGLSQDELDTMLVYATLMAKPFCEKRGIVAQDRDFLNKAEWPYWEETEKRPLLLHYHPLTIYRYQVAKQADAVLALMLFPDAERPEVVEKSVRYYDEVTTHDSSLSYSAFSVVYNRVGDTKKACEYFLKNARLDLDNTHGNTKDGLHMASMGGTLMNILYGFCDLRVSGGTFTLNPRLPAEIGAIKFSFWCGGKVYRVSVTKDGYSAEGCS